MTTERNITPQAVPLFAVAEHVDGVDLFLVVGWEPVGATHAIPVMVTLASTDARPSTAGETYHLPNGEEVRLDFHTQLAYHDDRDEARQDYAEAAATFNAGRAATGSEQ